MTNRLYLILPLVMTLILLTSCLNDDDEPEFRTFPSPTPELVDREDILDWIQEQTAFSAQFPGCVPPGYGFESAGTTGSPDTPSTNTSSPPEDARLEYTSSSGRLLLVQSPELSLDSQEDDSPATQVPVDGTTAEFRTGMDTNGTASAILRWSDGELYFDLTVTPSGDVPLHVLLQMAGSMQQEPPSSPDPGPCR